MPAISRPSPARFNARYGSLDVAAKLEDLRQDLAARGRLLGRVGYSIDLFDLPPESGASP